MVRCIGLDLGGVMVEINAYWADALQQAGYPRQELGHLVDFHGTDLAGNGSWGDEQYFEELATFLSVDREGAEKVHDAILKADYPGVRELVLAIKAAGLKVACLSNTNRRHLDVIVRDSTSVAELDHVVASFQVGFNKPEPGIYDAFEQIVGCGGHEIVFFDDWPPNIAGAEEVGWRAFLTDPKGDPAAQVCRHLASLGVSV
jgi:putative hydrolase of the HAD superfamily